MTGIADATGMLPMADGVIVVVFVLVLAIGLSLGYAVLERSLLDLIRALQNRE